MRSFETVSERDLITMIVALERMSEEFSASEAKDKGATLGQLSRVNELIGSLKFEQNVREPL